jgi:hypothetical protein
VAGPVVTLFTPQLGFLSSAVPDLGLRLFLKTGAQFPVDGDSTALVTGINAIPMVEASVRRSTGVSVPVLAGFSIPVANNTELLLGGGAIFSDRQFLVRLRDAGAAPGSPTYGGVIDNSGFDPAVIFGLRHQPTLLFAAQGSQRPHLAPVVTLDIMLSFPESQSMAFISPNFASQTTTVVTPAEPEVSVMFGVGFNLPAALGPRFEGTPSKRYDRF